MNNDSTTQQQPAPLSIRKYIRTKALKEHEGKQHIYASKYIRKMYRDPIKKIHSGMRYHMEGAESWCLQPRWYTQVT